MNFTEDAIVKLLTSCPLCNSKKLTPVLSEKNNFPKGVHPEIQIFDNAWINLLKCHTCSFSFTEQIPVSPTFFSNRYDNPWYNPEEETDSSRKSEILEKIFSTLKSYNLSSGYLLDVGSFSGKLLKEAKNAGFTPEGVEINPKMAKFANEKLGFNVICSEFQKLKLEKNKYQAITIIDVLEHLVEPRIVLLNLAHGLAPGGILVIKVPNYPMQRLKQKIINLLGISKEGIFAHFGHINHFTITSMEKILKDIDLELIQVSVAPSEKWNHPSTKNILKNIFRTFYYKLALSLNVEMGLNIFYYARKK